MYKNNLNAVFTAVQKNTDNEPFTLVIGESVGLAFDDKFGLTYLLNALTQADGYNNPFATLTIKKGYTDIAKYDGLINDNWEVLQ